MFKQIAFNVYSLYKCCIYTICYEFLIQLRWILMLKSHHFKELPSGEFGHMWNFVEIFNPPPPKLWLKLFEFCMKWKTICVHNIDKNWNMVLGFNIAQSDVKTKWWQGMEINDNVEGVGLGLLLDHIRFQLKVGSYQNNFHLSFNWSFWNENALKILEMGVIKNVCFVFLFV